MNEPNTQGTSLLDHAGVGNSQTGTGAGAAGTEGQAAQGAEGTEGQGGEGNQGGQNATGQGAGEGNAPGGAQEGQGGAAGAGGEGAGEGAGEGEGQQQRPEGAPEWLTETKFWDTDKAELRTELLFKNYADLRAKISRGDHQPPPDTPEEYEIEVKPELMTKLGIEKLSDDPLVAWFRKAAHEADLPQSVVQRMVSGYFEEAAKYVPVVDAKAEIAALGPNGQAMIDEMATWAGDLHKKGVLSDEDYAELRGLTATAPGVRLISRIRNVYEEKPIPIDPSPTNTGLPSKDELRKMANSKEYQTDPDYRARVDAQYEAVYGSQPAGQSIVERP